MQYWASTNATSEKRLFALVSLGVLVLVTLFAKWELSREDASYQPVLYTLDESVSSGFVPSIQRSDSQWVTVENPVNLGFSDEAHWFRFQLPAAILNHQPLYAEIKNALLDRVEVWVAQKEGFTRYTLGDEFAFAERPLHYSYFVFPLPVSAQPLTVYIKVHTSSVMKLPLSIWPRNEYGVHIGDINLSIGMFFGLLLVIGISALFFFFTTGTGTFLYYGCYVFCLDLMVAALHGYGFQYLWPEQVGFQSFSVTLFASSSALFALLFFHSILAVKKHSKWLDVLFKLTSASFITLMMSAMLISDSVSIKLLLVLLTIGVTLIMVTAVWFAIRKINMAAYYGLAWSPVLASLVCVGLENVGVISTGISSLPIFVYGATIEAVMLALILAIRYKRRFNAMLAAKQEAFKKEREAVSAKQQLIEMQRHNQEELEYKVQERTLELEIALRELSEVNAELERSSTIDSLTGIHNRRYFDKRLQSECRRSRREQTQLAVAMIDIDHFKLVNDRYGHAVGDACIQHIAAILKNNLKRESDDVCRYGGEEFALILPNTDIAGAYSLLENMRQIVASSPCLFDGESISLTISGGVASTLIFQQNDDSELLKTADKRLYIAKQQGRNRVIAESTN